MPDIAGENSGPVERTVEPRSPKVYNTPPATFLEFSGYQLTAWVLGGLFGTIMVLLAIMVFVPHSRHDAVTISEASKLILECVKVEVAKDICPSAKLELARSIVGDPTAHREFWKGMFEKIVGTTLLPIVTALLGYLFGAQGRTFLAATAAESKVGRSTTP